VIGGSGLRSQPADVDDTIDASATLLTGVSPHRTAMSLSLARRLT
jgi:hypothetical protein